MNTPTNLDPQSDNSAVLEQWVTKGISPGPIIATKFKNDSDAAQGVQMTRPLCSYPEIAMYKGPGDTTTAVNFTCQQPPSK
jgi:feruloyl esterase